MGKSRVKDVLCFGGEDWWYHNRGHTDMQLMRRFARLGTVLYINSIVMQKPNLSQGRTFLKKLIRKTKSILTGLKKSDVGFWVYSPFSLPVQHLNFVKTVNEFILKLQIWLVARKLKMRNPIVWVACPTACNIALKIRKSSLVYQRTDRFEDTPNVDTKIIEKYDRRLKAAADLTIYVNRLLCDAEADQCKKAFFLDHGVDYAMFASAENTCDIPAEMADIKKPIVGYIGGMADHKLDIELIIEVIELLPEFSFVFIGDASQEYRDMFTKDNVKILGKQPYERIPYFGKCFDVAMLPWKINRWTDAANPIKLKEYLALGKPIVSTRLPELQNYLDVVYAADTAAQFTESIKRALSEDSRDWIKTRRRKVKDASWDSKAEKVLNKLFQ
jgi:glycosyltransferase involved in cell wall biosynthesis